MVVDGTLGFTGGMNIREGNVLALPTAHPIRDIHFKVRGPIVEDLRRAFAIDWAFTSGERLDGPAWFPRTPQDTESEGGVYARGIPDGPDTDMDNMRLVMLGALAAAQYSVKIVTPYFLPDSAITAALQTTALRGVRVDIILPEKSNIFFMDWAMEAQLSDLIDRGCRITLSPPPFDHSKLFVVDGLWSLIGSTNWDPRSLRLNFEYNLECYDPPLAHTLETLIDERIEKGRPLTAEYLRSLPRARRLRDGFARLLTPYL
jgi:cardiolipin synthase